MPGADPPLAENPKQSQNSNFPNSKRSIHNDIGFFVIVIPGLIRNPVFSWIPVVATRPPGVGPPRAENRACAGMTCIVENYFAVYILIIWVLEIRACFEFRASNFEFCEFIL
jgi:hypothetical protein